GIRPLRESSPVALGHELVEVRWPRRQPPMLPKTVVPRGRYREERRARGAGIERVAGPDRALTHRETLSTHPACPERPPRLGPPGWVARLRERIEVDRLADVDTRNDEGAGVRRQSRVIALTLTEGDPRVPATRAPQERKRRSVDQGRGDACIDVRWRR